MAGLNFISFGFGHDEGIPAADMVLDVRPFRDPHVDPAFRELTGRDSVVWERVLATPGVEEFILASAKRIDEERVSGEAFTVAVGCTGGKHRAYVVAEKLAWLLGGTVEHRDVDLRVIVHPVADEDGA